MHKISIFIPGSGQERYFIDRSVFPLRVGIKLQQFLLERTPQYSNLARSRAERVFNERVLMTGYESEDVTDAGPTVCVGLDQSHPKDWRS